MQNCIKMTQYQKAVHSFSACVWPLTDSNPSPVNCSISALTSSSAEYCLLFPLWVCVTQIWTASVVHPDASTDCPLFRENLSGRGIGTNIRYVALCVIAAMLFALTRLHRQEIVCIFGHSKVTLQWHFIIWMTSRQMGSPSYPEVDPDLCQRQLLEVISAGLTHV